MEKSENNLGMKWAVKLTQRKIARGLVLAGWRSLLIPAVIFTGVVVLMGVVASLTIQMTAAEVVQSFLVPFFSYMIIIVLTYAFSIWLVARLSYKRILRQGASDIQTQEIKDGKLIYSAAGDEIQLTLANVFVAEQYPGVVVLKRDKSRRFYLLFDNPDEQVAAVKLLSAK